VSALFREFEPLILLLRTLGDFDYQPPTSTGAIVQRQAKAGEGPSERISCESCGGEGRRRIRGVERQCEPCSGRGWIVVDAYTGRRVGTAETELVDPRRRVRCDACGGDGAHGNGRRCSRCDGRGEVAAPERPVRPWRGQGIALLKADAPELGPGDPVIACMERRQLAGSYDELGLALACLRLEYRGRYRLLVGVFVEAEREVEQLHIDEALAVEQALRYLRGLMPEEIRVPSWAARYEKRRRERVEAESAAA
jgi:hypothetical protein